MILIGHRFIPSEPLYHIGAIDAIEKTPPSSVVYFEFSKANLDIIEHCRLNDVPFALYVATLTEAVYASALGALYIVIPKELAKTTQKIADAYLFDAKILVACDDEDAIEELAILGVDGVIFPNGIVKVNA